MQTYQGYDNNPIGKFEKELMVSEYMRIRLECNVPDVNIGYRPNLSNAFEPFLDILKMRYFNDSMPEWYTVDSSQSYRDKNVDNYNNRVIRFWKIKLDVCVPSSDGDDGIERGKKLLYDTFKKELELWREQVRKNSEMACDKFLKLMEQETRKRELMKLDDNALIEKMKSLGMEKRKDSNGYMTIYELPFNIGRDEYRHSLIIRKDRGLSYARRINGEDGLLGAESTGDDMYAELAKIEPKKENADGK